MASASRTRPWISAGERRCRRGPKAMFSLAVMCGKSANCWKTVLTGRKFGGTPRIGWPLMRISPEVGSTKPATARKSVVFPQPLGPKSAMNSPLRIARETPARAVTGPYLLTRLSTTTTSSVMRLSHRQGLVPLLPGDLSVPDLGQRCTLGIEGIPVGNGEVLHAAAGAPGHARLGPIGNLVMLGRRADIELLGQAIHRLVPNRIVDELQRRVGVLGTVCYVHANIG